MRNMVFRVPTGMLPTPGGFVAMGAMAVLAIWLYRNGK